MYSMIYTYSQRFRLKVNSWNHKMIKKNSGWPKTALKSITLKNKTKNKSLLIFCSLDKGNIRKLQGMCAYVACGAIIGSLSMQILRNVQM